MYDLPTPQELRNQRLRAGLTQAALAKRAGVSQSLIARIEAGDVDPRLSTLCKILDALKETDSSVKLTAADVMKTPVVHVKPEDTVGHTSKLMEKYGFSQLPVLENNLQVGSVSEARVVRVLSSERDISRIPSKKVEEIMNDGFPTISKNTDLKTVSRLAEVNPAILVTEKGRVIGIITKADLLRLTEG